jgi:hypothetical protein
MRARLILQRKEAVPSEDGCCCAEPILLTPCDVEMVRLAASVADPQHGKSAALRCLQGSRLSRFRGSPRPSDALLSRRDALATASSAQGPPPAVRAR